MSLTKQDLRAIKGVVEETVEAKLEEKLESNLEEKLESNLEEKLESKLEEKLESKLEEKLRPLKKDVRYIKKTLNLIIGRYDPIVTDHEHRLEEVEAVLKIARE